MTRDQDVTGEVSLDLSELRAVTRSFGTSFVRVGLKAAAVLRKTGMDIVRDSQTLAPVDTGNLRNSIGVEFVGDGRTANMSLEAGPTADYGLFVERGTSRTGPQPYMGPAFDRREPIFEAAIAQLAAQELLE